MHLTAALFTQKAQVKIPLVAYRGSAPVANDLLGGHIPLAVLDVTASVQLVQEGKLKALAVSAAKRVDLLPQVATLPEPASRATIRRLVRAGGPRRHAAGHRGQSQRGVRQGDERAGTRPEAAHARRRAETQHPEAFGQFIRSESAKWAKVVAEAGIKPE